MARATHGSSTRKNNSNSVNLVGQRKIAAAIELVGGDQAVKAILPALREDPGIDAGEGAALSLAIELHADAVLIDKRMGTR